MADNSNLLEKNMKSKRLWCLSDTLLLLFCLGMVSESFPTRCYGQLRLIIWKWNGRWNWKFWFRAICDKIHCNPFKPLTHGNMPTEVKKCCFKLMPGNKGLRITLQKPKWLMRFGRWILWACVEHLGQQAREFPKTQGKISSTLPLPLG